MEIVIKFKKLILQNGAQIVGWIHSFPANLLVKEGYSGFS